MVRVFWLVRVVQEIQVVQVAKKLHSLVGLVFKAINQSLEEELCFDKKKQFKSTFTRYPMHSLNYGI